MQRVQTSVPGGRRGQVQAGKLQRQGAVSGGSLNPIVT